MDTRLATKQCHLQYWSGIIQDRIQSGLKVDDYCEEHNLSRNKYYYWLREIKKKALQSDYSETIKSQDVFVDISTLDRPSSNESGSVAAIISLNGCDIRLTNEASSAFIRNLLGVVSHAQ